MLPPSDRRAHIRCKRPRVFFGLSLRHTKTHMARAVLRVWRSACRTALIWSNCDTDVNEIRRQESASDFWRQILDVFNTKMTTTNATEGPAYGAALLAAVGVGHFDSVESACDQCLRIVSQLDPIESNVKRYAEGKALYRSLYPALKPSFDMAAGLV